MRQILCAVLLASLAFTSAVFAQSEVSSKRELIGKGRLFSNDFLGDNQDRWRTGAYAVSRVYGYGWDGELPGRAGNLIEFRFRSDIIAPENIVTAAPGDRRYVGALSLGAHTHFQNRGFAFALGVDMVVTGPQTGVGDFQDAVHQLLDAPRPGVLGNQIPNGFHPTLTFATGRSIDLSDAVNLHPFVELQAGVETLARTGIDLTIGRLGRDQLMIRDVATGQRYSGTKGTFRGFAGVIGADVAFVAHSTYLPASSGYALTDMRTRLRAGLHWQGEKSTLFYGLTYLGEEFKAQPEGQVLGSIRLDIKF